MNELLRDLLKTENRVLLWVLLGLLALFATYLLYLTKRGHLKWKLPFVESSKDGGETEKADASSKERRYRKVLYVKVTYLSDRSRVSEPFYRRTVPRLGETAEPVPVFDEAVYYSLELLPKKGPLIARKERSSGVVDPRVVIPWQDRVAFRDVGAGQIREFVQLESDEGSDALLSISHFDNGLQGKNNQDVSTDVAENAEYVRLIVDFSSVPNAARFISAERATLHFKGQEAMVPTAQVSPGVFTATCSDVTKNSVLSIHFRFDWEKST